MPRGGTGDARFIRPDAFFIRLAASNLEKFGLRTMKSLRKIIVGTSLAVILAPLFYLAAQPPQSLAPLPPSSQTARPPAASLSDAQARITVNSNLVILPVTVKSHSG